MNISTNTQIISEKIIAGALAIRKDALKNVLNGKKHILQTQQHANSFTYKHILQQKIKKIKKKKKPN